MCLFLVRANYMIGRQVCRFVEYNEKKEKVRMYILKPSFYDKFTCIGDKCKMTCCGGWGIRIRLTPEKYQAYLAVDGFISECAKKAFAYNSDKGTYNVIFDERKLCPFCDKEQLCEIVKQLGPDAIGEICATFPRIQATSGIMDELYLSLGCPWVVELLMETEDVLSFEVQEDANELEAFEDEVAYQLVLRDWKIRDRILDFLQNREIDFSFRQFYAEYCLEKIKGYQDMQPLSKMESVLDELLLADNYLALSENLSSANRNNFHSVQYGIYKDALLMFDDCIRQLACRDKDNTYQKFEELLSRNQSIGFHEWNMAYSSWMSQSERSFSILSEKILSYDWMIFALYGSDKYYMLHNYLKILIRNILVKQFHILYFSLHGEIPDSMSYIIVAMVSRSVDHGSKYINQLLSKWEKDGILDTAYMYILLQN